MNAKSKFSKETLRSLIETDLAADEIMDELGIQTRQTFKRHLLRLIQEDGVVYRVRGITFTGGTSAPTINKAGDLKITRRNLQELGAKFLHGDQFTLEYQDGKITLTPMISESELSDS